MSDPGDIVNYGPPKRRHGAQLRPEGNVRRAPDGHPDEAPAEAIVRLNVACNQHCFFCNTDARAENLHLTHTAVEGYLRTNRHALYASFSGGEPTINPHLLRYIRFARGLGIPRVIIQTNAMMASYDKYAAQLVEAGLTGAFVSLHAPNATLSDRITASPGTWELTLQGARNLLDRGVEVEVNTVINQLNFSSLPEHAAFIVERFPEVAAVSLSFVAPTGFCHVTHKTIPRIRDVQPFLFRALDVFRHAGMTAIIPDRCGIPLCTVPGYESHHEALMASPFAGTGLVTEDHMKHDGCASCVWNQRCIGYWRRSVDLWGTDDLIPVTEPVDVQPQAMPYAALERGAIERFLADEVDRLAGAANQS